MVFSLTQTQLTTNSNYRLIKGEFTWRGAKCSSRHKMIITIMNAISRYDLSFNILITTSASIPFLEWNAIWFNWQLCLFLSQFLIYFQYAREPIGLSTHYTVHMGSCRVYDRFQYFRKWLRALIARCTIGILFSFRFSSVFFISIAYNEKKYNFQLKN